MSEEISEIIETVSWNENGLVPVIAQSTNDEVLTLAYMDEEALRLTISTGLGHYFSRSKGRIRKKGEVSGNLQSVEEIRIDCDGDALLMKVNQQGPACHTGKKSCFYRQIGEPVVEEGSIDYSLDVLKELEEVIRNRKESPREDSYTSELFREGPGEIKKKVGEEAVEVIVSPERENLVAEVADLMYHLLVLLRSRGVELGEVMNELRRRRK